MSSSARSSDGEQRDFNPDGGGSTPPGRSNWRLWVQEDDDLYTFSTSQLRAFVLDVRRAEAIRCAAMATLYRHPIVEGWIDEIHSKTKRERFYQYGIRHAWVQAGIKIAEAIRKKGMKL